MRHKDYGIFLNVERDDQKMYYFDHGSICLKNCKPFFNMSRKKIDYFFSPSPNYDAIYCNQMSIEYPNKKMLYLGYPRHDIFYVDSEKEIEKLTLKKYNKVILWMPTFRKGGGFKRNDSLLDFEYGIPLINTEKDFCEINDILKKNNTLLIIKIHPKQDIDTIKKLKTICFENVFIVDNDVVKEKNIDVFKLLKNTDALISDYSSITYSYILLDATSFDSIAYTAACYSYKKLEENEHPHKLVSLLWCILLIVLPIALVFSESSMNNIQSISIISAFPIGIIMIIMIWGFIKDIKIYMKKELKGKEWQNN